MGHIGLTAFVVAFSCGVHVSCPWYRIVSLASQYMLYSLWFVRVGIMVSPDHDRASSLCDVISVSRKFNNVLCRFSVPAVNELAKSVAAAWTIFKFSY